MLFQELLSWLLVVALGAIVLLIASAVFTYHGLRQRYIWWQYLLPAIALIVSVWSFIVVNNAFRLFQDINASIPHHGAGIYANDIKSSAAYQQNVLACQVQIGVTCLVLILLFVIDRWQIARRKIIAPALT